MGDHIITITPCGAICSCGQCFEAGPRPKDDYKDLEIWAARRKVQRINANDHLRQTKIAACLA